MEFISNFLVDLLSEPGINLIKVGVMVILAQLTSYLYTLQIFNKSILLKGILTSVADFVKDRVEVYFHNKTAKLIVKRDNPDDPYTAIEYLKDVKDIPEEIFIELYEAFPTLVKRFKGNKQKLIDFVKSNIEAEVEKLKKKYMNSK